MEIEIINNTADSRFETEVEGELAHLDYKFYKDDLVLIHTFAPPAARGKGISSALAKFALDYAIDNKLKVVVYCPFVKAYLEKHPEYAAKLSIEYRS
jgi:predicted GNAT family acetyltransferase